MAEIIAYAAADSGVGFRNLGTIGIFKTFSEAKKRIDHAYIAQKTAGFVILVHDADQLVSLNPETDTQHAYWIIHV